MCVDQFHAHPRRYYFSSAAVAANLISDTKTLAAPADVCDNILAKGSRISMGSMLDVHLEAGVPGIPK